MNNEPIQFLPPNKFWEEEKRRADREASMLYTGLAIGMTITAVCAWIIFEIVNRHS